MHADLLTELAQLPQLPGASCRGLEWLYDQTVPTGRGLNTDQHEARKQAAAVCARCPALAECRQWVDQLPRAQRPRGVVAGALTDSQGRRYRQRHHAQEHAA